jgi:hypothetical protein
VLILQGEQCPHTSSYCTVWQATSFKPKLICFVVIIRVEHVSTEATSSTVTERFNSCSLAKQQLNLETVMLIAALIVSSAVNIWYLVELADIFHSLTRKSLHIYTKNFCLKVQKFSEIRECALSCRQE